jgi:oligosaccharide repeat unit polymerase
MLQHRANTYAIIFVNITICLSVVLYRLVDADTGLAKVLVIQSYAILSLIVLHSYAWFKQGGSDLSLGYLFFLMVFIFNGGKAILFVFFPEYEEPYFTFFKENDYQILARAYEFTYIGMLVISIALLLNADYKKIEEVPPTDIELTAAKITALLFLSVSFPAAVYDLQSMLMKVISGGYFALFESEQAYGASGIVKVLGFFLFPSFYIALIAFRQTKWLIYCILIFAGVFTAVKLAMGARLVALVPFLILLSLWDVTIEHVKRKLIYVSGLFMVAVVFPALSVLRVGDKLEEGGGVGHSVFKIVKEMSDSMSPLAWIMQRVPWEMDFQYGHSFLLAASTALPNLFWDAHPAQKGSLALWLAIEIDPWIAAKGGGFGFSIFAEYYLNFYWFGLVLLFLTTIFISNMSKVKSNAINTAFCFSCFLGFMLWPRGELVAVARFILWNVGIPWLCYHFMISALQRYR